MAVLLLFAACGSHPYQLYPADEVARRFEQHVQVHRPAQLFYTGLGQGDTVEQALEQALQQLTERLHWASAAGRVLVQRLHHVDLQATDADGNAHVLVVVERSSAAAELRRLGEEKRAVLRSTLVECRRQLELGALERARHCVRGAEQQLGEAHALLAASQQALGKPSGPPRLAEEGQLAQVVAELGKQELRRRSILVQVISTVDGRRGMDLNDAFAQVATRRGFRVLRGALGEPQIEKALAGKTEEVAALGRRSGAGYVIVGLIAARYNSEEGGQTYAWASGKAKVIDATSGASVAELAYDKIKGGFFSRAQASEQAIQETVLQLQAQLHRKLAALQ